MSCNRREFCKNLALLTGGIALAQILGACETYARLTAPEADPFVRDLLLNAPLALPLEAPTASFKPEYDGLWSQYYLNKTEKPTTSQVTEIIKKTISHAKNSSYDPFNIMGKWLDGKLTIPPELRKPGGVELMVLPTLNNAYADRAIFSAGYLQRDGSVDFYLKANTTGFSHHYRDADRKHLQIAIYLAHEFQHFQDFEKIIKEGLAQGIPYVDIVRSIEKTNAYLFEARSYFLDTVLSIIFTPWEKSLKPDGGESIRNDNYYQMYDLAERLTKEGSSWTDKRWLGLIQKLLKEGKLSTRRKASDNPPQVLLPPSSIVFPTFENAVPNLQFA